MKLTELGKDLRKIRIERDEVLFDMAKRLEISAAMLSAVETGTKPAPDAFIERLAEHYPEVEAERTKFEHLAQMTKKMMKVSLDLPEQAKETAIVFNRVLPQITDEDLAAIADVIRKYRVSDEKNDKGRNS